MAFITEAAEQGKLETRDLGGDFSQWINVTGEGAVSVTREAGKDGKQGLRWTVQVDHRTDGGGEGGDYPIGWPRVYRAFDRDELDMTPFDYLLFQIRVDSDRDEVADDSTPVGFTIHSNRFYEVSRDLGGRQRVWLPVLFPIRSMIETVGQGEARWRSIEKVQLFISERNYADGTNLTFDVAEVTLLRFRSPMLRRLNVPRFVTLPRPVLPVGFEVMGTRSVREGTHAVEAALVDDRGRTQMESTRDLAADGDLLLDTTRLQPGTYTLNVVIRSADGTRCSQSKRRLEFRPLFDDR